MKKNLLTIALVSFALVLSGCSSQETSTKVESSDSQSEQEQTPQPTEPLAPSLPGIGETAAAEGFDITVNGARFSTSGSLGTEPDNGKFVIFDVTFSNFTGTTNISMSTLSKFEIQGSDYKKYDFGFFDQIDTSLGSTVDVGFRGELAFDAPELESYTLTYKNDGLSDVVQFEIPGSEFN